MHFVWGNQLSLDDAGSVGRRSDPIRSDPVYNKLINDAEGRSRVSRQGCAFKGFVVCRLPVDFNTVFSSIVRLGYSLPVSRKYICVDVYVTKRVRYVTLRYVNVTLRYVALRCAASPCPSYRCSNASISTLNTRHHVVRANERSGTRGEGALRYYDDMDH